MKKRVGKGNLTRDKETPLLNPMILVRVMSKEEQVKELWMVSSKHSFSWETFSPTLHMSVPIRGHGEISTICRSMCIVFKEHKLTGNLLVWTMGHFDVILGMNWLSKY